MHKYLRAVGFSSINNKDQIGAMLGEAIMRPTYRAMTTWLQDSDQLFAEYRLEVAEGIGVCVCGEYDENDRFAYEYYYPYFTSDKVSTMEEVTVEERIDTDSFAGVCDDLKVGVTIIFRLNNIVEYLKTSDRRDDDEGRPPQGTSVSLSALSVDGQVMLPIFKTEKDRQVHKKTAVNRMRLMNAARSGDEDAMRDLTLEDMDNYSLVMDKIQDEDVFSLVDTYFMPYGVECDLYSVLAEITDCELVRNRLTGEQLWRMTLDCNDLKFDLLINRSDLYGEPAVGRRFKGVIWMQGVVNYPDEAPMY